MPRTHIGSHHDPSEVINLRGLGVVLALGCFFLSPPAWAATDVALPTRADLHLGSLLPPLPGKFPNRIPRQGGTIEETERVTVGLRADGSVQEIIVEQTILLGGVGDYSLEISGPATAVEQLPGSDAAPGLRNGSLIWEGFCPGARTLRARITMDPAALRFTPLPLVVQRTATGVRLSNASGEVQQLSTGDTDPRALAAALAATRAALARGRLPVPGQDGIPVAIAVGGTITTRPERVRVPLRVRGVIGTETIDAVLTDRPLDIAAPPDASITLSGNRVLPVPATLNPRKRDFRALQRVLWQSARIAGEGYLGIPFDGAVRVDYVFGPATAAPAPPPPPKTRERPRPIPIAVASVMMLGIAAAGRRWWVTH